MTEYARLENIFPAAHIPSSLRDGADEWTVSTRDDGRVHLTRDIDVYNVQLATSNLRARKIEREAAKRTLSVLMAQPDPDKAELASLNAQITALDKEIPELTLKSEERNTEHWDFPKNLRVLKIEVGE